MGQLTVGIDHQDTSGRSSILIFDRSGIDRPVFGHVGRVIDNAADQTTTAKVILNVRADFELHHQYRSCLCLLIPDTHSKRDVP